MTYRVCKAFEVESGHMLSRHPGACRHPHGHSRRIEIVLSAETLDDNDMVCDFKAIRLAVGEFIRRFDHSTAISSDDPLLERVRAVTDRLVVFEGQDPTTEAMARLIYDHVASAVREGATLTDESGAQRTLRRDLRVERVRVSETATTWAEYAP